MEENIGMKTGMYDYHVHTDFSDGKNTLDEMLEAAKQAGLEAVAITDHFDPNDPRPSISDLKTELLLEQFAQIRQLSGHGGLRLLRGIETTPLPDGRLDIPEDVMAGLDIVITSCHYIPYEGEMIPGEIFCDPYWQRFQEILLNMAAGEGTVLGHSEEYLPIQPLLQGVKTTFEQRREICRSIADRYMGRPFIEKLTENLLKSGKACELHCATSSPRGWVIEYMARRGVRFSPGSDAHGAAYIGKVEFAFQMAERYGLTLLHL